MVLSAPPLAVSSLDFNHGANSVHGYDSSPAVASFANETLVPRSPANCEESLQEYNDLLALLPEKY
jgi:hypothetical protein